MPITLIPSQGTKLSIKMGSPLAYSLIDGITDLTKSGGEKETIPGTAISDTAPRSVGGFPSPEVWEGQCNYDPNDPVHAELEAAKAAGAKRLFKLELNTSPAFVRYFDAEVTAFASFSASGNSIVGCPIRLAQDGAMRASEV